MLSPNDPQLTPDWVPPLPRAWDDKACCPADCTLCEPAEDHLILGDN